MIDAVGMSCVSAKRGAGVHVANATVVVEQQARQRCCGGLTTCTCGINCTCTCQYCYCD